MQIISGSRRTAASGQARRQSTVHVVVLLQMLLSLVAVVAAQGP
jgi:hypothetical protein